MLSYLVIPAEILHNPSFVAIDKVLLSYFSCLRRNNKRFFGTTNYLAQALCLHVGEVMETSQHSLFPVESITEDKTRELVELMASIGERDANDEERLIGAVPSQRDQDELSGA